MREVQLPPVARCASTERPNEHATIPNLHDRRALETIVEGLDTDAIAQCLDEGGLSEFAREVVAAELARRVLADGFDHLPRAHTPVGWFLDRALDYLPAAGYLLWLLLSWAIG